MTYDVIVTEQAALEAEEAVAWWALQRSVEQATRWYAGLRQMIADLADNPQRYAIAAERKHFSYEIREFHFGLGSRPTHRVIFTILPETVVVLSIRHAAQRTLRPENIKFPT